MNIGITITSVVVAFVFGYITRFVIAKIKLNSREIITHKLLQSAREQADNERKTMLSEIQKERNRLESENRDRKAEIQKLENRVLQREVNLDKKTQYLENKEHNIENKMKKIKEQEDKLERLIEDEEKELERIAGLTKEEAKANLINDIEEDAKKSAAKIVDNIEKNAIETGERKAREIIVQTIQRLSSEVAQESSVTSVSLPSEEMKGRIIGREGRNIRMLETLTGVDIIIDDTPEAVVISCFDPVRKHIAKVSLEKLILDGRIHPARIEEVVERTRREVEDMWNFYDVFVFSNHPIYDAIRKMAYGTREAVLYIDTDSNFIALNRWVEQIRHEFFEDQYRQDPKEMIFICANIITIFLTNVVDRNLKMFARNSGVSEKWAQYLSMKNEFFFWRILFGDVKKRYIDLQMIQEGKLLKDGKGIPEIKGYDLQKSTTKENVKDFYTALCMEQILSPDKIDLKGIMLSIDSLKKEIKRSMEAGESLYFRQANVNPPEHYAMPLRISGIKAVMLWNALCPEYAIELPSDVDIVPIRNLNTEKGREWLSLHYPEIYARFEREILHNRNPQIASMQCNVIAKPKNVNVPMPEWLKDAMDTAKVINSTVKLISPIMESLGLKVQRPSSSKEYLTNIVDL